MCDEKPVGLKRKSSAADEHDSGLHCVCHYENCFENEVRELTDKQYQTLHSSVLVRQSQTTSGARLDDICSTVPTVFDSSIHGAHRSCFKKFTNVSRLQLDVNVGASTSARPSTSSSDVSESCATVRCRSSDRKAASSSKGLLFPQNECLFCHKEYKYLRGSRNKETLVTCQTVCSEDTIKYYALLKNDFQLLGCIEDENLRAREARYHPSCRKMYTKPTTTMSVDTDLSTAEVEEDSATLADGRTAYAEAFQYLAQYVLQHIITDGQVQRMVMLKQKYLEYMQSNYPDFYNPMYSTQSLKTKLVSKFSDQLTFWQPQSRFKSELVFSSNLDIGEAVEAAFNALSSERSVLQRAATILRRDIETAFKTTDDMPWPPPADHLLGLTTPERVTNFISQVIAGKNMDEATEKSARWSTSFAEDLCYGVTNGRWMTSKHALLGMALRHLTGRADVITVVNRYGHCMSYSKVLELETPLAMQVQLTRDGIPSNLSRTSNIVCHLCWDNFDLMEETASGRGTTHSTHGIVVQEVSQTSIADVPNVVSVPRTGSRTVEPSHLFAVQSVMVPKKVEPVTSVTSMTAASLPASLCSTAQSLYWITCRALFNNNASVPDWSGWISKTTTMSQQVKPSNVGYMSPISHLSQMPQLCTRVWRVL